MDYFDLGTTRFVVSLSPAQFTLGVTKCLSSLGYRWSFFFVLDLVAWLSLIPDVLLLFQDNASEGGGASVDQLTVARAGRAARAGTRYTFVIHRTLIFID